MSIFQMFGKRTDINEGVKRSQETPEAVLLDVRTAAEYAGGHIPGSVNLPLDRLNEISIEKKVPLFVYCQSGMRSRAACAQLREMGYKAENIGGIADYRGRLE